MFCSNCGKKIDDGSKFCPFCGRAIGGTTQSNGQASSMPAGSQTPNMLGRPVVKTAKKPISKNTVVGMVACLIAVLAIVGIVKVFSGVSNKSEVKRTNKELVAEVENVATETDKEINNPVNEINSDKDTDTGSKLVKTSFDWKQVYIDYFNQNPDISQSLYSYAFADIQDDGVPEIYCCNLLEGNLFYINSNGEVKDFGYCINNCGYCENKLFVHSGYGYSKHVDTVYTYNTKTNEYEEEYTSYIAQDGNYILGGAVTSEEEYISEIKKYIDYDNLIWLNDSLKNLNRSIMNSSIVDVISLYNDEEYAEKNKVWQQIFYDYFSTPSDSVPFYARNYNIVDINLDGVAEVYIEEIPNGDSTYSSSLYFINKDNMVDKITAPCPSQFCCFNNSLHILTHSNQELVYAYNDETGSYDLVFDGIVDTVIRKGKSTSDEKVLPAEYASALSEFWDENADYSAISSLGNGDAGKNGDFFDDSRFDANVIREALERWSEV